MATTRTADYLFDGADDPLADEVAAWLTASPRFRAFADAHRDKIRKKLRGARDDDARRDVRAELRVAQLLLADKRIEIEFEAYGSGNPGPDFTITTRGVRFNLEVTRLRGAAASAGFGGLLAKVRQLPPSVPNGVILAIQGADAAAYDLAEAVRALLARSEARDEALFTARGFSGSRAFRDRIARLGVAFVWADAGVGASRVVTWTNPSARISMPPRATRAVAAALRAG